MSLDNPYDSVTKKISSDIFDDLDATNSYTHRRSSASAYGKRSTTPTDVTPVVTSNANAPPRSASTPPSQRRTESPVANIAVEEVIQAAPVVAATRSSSHDAHVSPHADSPSVPTAAVPIANVVPDNNTIPSRSSYTRTGLPDLLEQVVAEAVAAKTAAASTNNDTSPPPENDPSRRFDFGDDDDDGDKSNAAAPTRTMSLQERAAQVEKQRLRQQELLRQERAKQREQEEAHQRLSAQRQAEEQQKYAAEQKKQAEQQKKQVEQQKKQVAQQKKQPKQTVVKDQPVPTKSAGAAVQYTAASSPTATQTATTTNTASTSSSVAPRTQPPKPVVKKFDGVQAYAQAKQHGFVLEAVELPGLPWLVRIGEPEVRNPMNPATKFVVYPVMTKSFGWLCERRYSDFVWLREHMLRTFPGVLVPPLPDKKFFGRFGDEFINKRREALERFLNKCTMHRQLRASDALRFFLEKRDSKQFELEKGEYAKLLPRLDYAVFEKPRVIDGDVISTLLPIINYLGVMHEFLNGLERLTSSLEQRRREEAEELQRMGAMFGSLFACAESGGYCWQDECPRCEVVGAQMQSLGDRSARVSQVVVDHGVNIYTAVWRSVRDECDVVLSLREQLEQRIALDAEYRCAVQTLKDTRARRAAVLASGPPKKGKDTPAARLENQALSEEAAAQALKFKLDYVTSALLNEIDAFHERKAATFGVLLNHYATQSAFAADQLQQAWQAVLRAAEAIEKDHQK